MFNTYYQLTKPRMVYMNVAVAAAAFAFGSAGDVNWYTLAAMVLGLAGVIAAACVFNNWADRNIDARMERTKNRGLASGAVQPTHALIFGTILLLVGATVLFAFTNVLSLGFALLGFVIYVFVYTPLKPRTGYALYAGAVAGATPPVVGYTAAAGMLDIWALALFLVLFLWQIPHFLAIARYRHAEYSAAEVPLLVAPAHTEEEKRRARKVFHYSLVFLVLFCLTLVLLR